MSNKFQLKRTSVSGRTPNTTSSSNTSFIDAGELAVNLADRKLFSSNGVAAFEVGSNLASLSVTGTASLTAISANGSLGTAGQVLTSNGAGLYWELPGQADIPLAGNGLSSNATHYQVLANTGIVANATGTYVNAAYIATVSSNNASYLSGYTWGAPAAIGGTTANSATFTDLTATGNTIVTGNTAFQKNVFFDDNVRAVFGSNSDLSIYHDGTNSRIVDNGRGELRLQGTNLRLWSASGENYITAVEDGAVTLYHNNLARIATTTTGANVSGDLTVTGDLSVTGNTTLGDAAADNVTINANTITISANSNIDAGTLYVDSLNNKVGVGTTTPGRKLAVSGDGIIIDNGTSTAVLEMYSSTDFRMQATTDWQLYDVTNAGARLFVASNGNVGIGNTTPANKFAVAGDVYVAGAGSSAYYNTINNSGLTSVSPSGTPMAVRLVQTGVADWSIYNEATTGNLRVGTVAQFSTNGNVGIGTTTPVGKLDVSGITYLGSDTNNSLFVNSNTSVVTIGAAGRSTFSTSALRFITSDGSSAVERARITSAGYWGVGVDPSYFVDINSPVQFAQRVAGPSGVYSDITDSTTTLRSQVSGSVGFVGTATNHAFSLMTNSTSRVRVTSGGNVGINNTSPAHTLSVTGTTNISGNATFAQDVTVSGNLVVSGTTTTVNTTNLDVTDAVIRLNSGQATPLNDIGILMQRYATANSTNYNVGFAWDEGSDRLIFGTTPEAGADNDLSFSTEWMTITSNGNVGIGTSSPVSTAGYGGLTLNGDTGGILSFAGLNTEYLRVFGRSTDSWIFTPTSAPLVLGTNSAERVRITDAGDVGIGTTNPSHKLSVVGTTNISGNATFGQNVTITGFANVVSGNVQLSSGFDVVSPDNFAIYDSTDSRDRFSFSTSNVYDTRSGGNHSFRIAGTSVANVTANTVVLSPLVGTLGSTERAFDLVPPSIASSHEARNFLRFQDMYNAGVNGQTLWIKTFSNGANYGGWMINSNWGGLLRLGASANNAGEANNGPSTYVQISTTSLATTGLTFSTGNTTITGDLSVTGNTTLGDAGTDRITFNANTITIAANASIDVGTLYIDSGADRVGIGNTTPASKLHVQGSVLVDNDDVSGAQLIVRGSTNTNNRLYIGYDTDDNVGRITAITEGTAFRNLVLQGGGGNVGIGNSSPSNKLFVTGDIGLDGISVRDTATSTTTATTQITLFEYPFGTYDSCDLLIKAVSGGARHITKLLVTANSTVAIGTEYGTLVTGNTLYTVDCDVSGSNTRIRITPASATSTVFKASYELITS